MDIFVKVVVISWLFTASMVKDSEAAATEQEVNNWGNKQLEVLLECISMPQERLDAAKYLVMDLQRVLQQQWPECKVLQFGSTISDVALYNSDVDCFVQPPSEPSYSTLYEARDVLAAHPHIFHMFNIKLNATVPHVQFTHIPTGHRCDVSFQAPEAIVQSRLLRYLLHLDDRARRLAIFIKYWTHNNRPAGSLKILSNHNIIMLVIFYLQQRHILPPIYRLQENLREHVTIDNWETGYNEIPYRTSNDDTLLELLSGFFEFYAHFEFENYIISTYSGTAIERRLFEQLDTIPDIYDTYKLNVARNKTIPINITAPVCIQNFFDHAYNDAYTTTQELLDRFRSNLQYAARRNLVQDRDSWKEVFNGTECF